MNEQKFREAGFIELHDSGVCIRPEQGDEQGWQEFSEYEGTQFSISGETICDIAQIFELPTSKIESKNPKDGKIHYHDPAFLEFEITKKRLEVGRYEESNQHGGMVKIKKLMARVEGPRLLHLLIYRYHEDEDAENGIFEYTQEVTYSGNYTVWWKPANDETDSK